MTLGVHEVARRLFSGQGAELGSRFELWPGRNKTTITLVNDGELVRGAWSEETIHN